MEISELLVWAGMLGGLLTIAVAALADALRNRSVAGWRALGFVVLLSSTCLLMTSLPALWFPEFPAVGLITLKASLGPLSGALAMNYLNLWLSAAAEDRLVHRSLHAGANTMLVAAVLLAIWAQIDQGQHPAAVLKVATAVCTLGQVLGLGASVRAYQLGDRLAGWMSLACLFLAGMVLGLYLYNLSPESFHWKGMAFAAFCTVAYFLVVMALTVTRNRENQNLQRLASLAQGADPATGLPTGSVLLSKVDDAFWRSARMHGQCSVICVHLHNLYELGESAGHRADQQILSAITARIRRAVGFRCVVGLYHPRCFVIVISGPKHDELLDHSVQRLHMVLSRTLTVVGLDEGFHIFAPRYGMGIVTVQAATADPVSVVDQAERKSWENAGFEPPSVAITQL